MRAQAFENLLKLIVDEYKYGSRTGPHMDNLIAKAQILLSRENDVSVLRELLNRE